LLEVVTDAHLAQCGHADDFATLYERHLPAVYRYVASRVGTREEAEDLTSDAFRQAWTNRHKYRGRGSFRAWLFTIVRRGLADHYRTRRPAAARLEAGLADDVIDERPSPEDHVVQDEREVFARQLLARLSPEQQEVLSLRFAAELSYAEIAVVIGKREEAIKKIAYRALESLRGSSAEHTQS
jgi:RNA polymerase sigma-70 factor (ECF subfamily)